MPNSYFSRFSFRGIARGCVIPFVCLFAADRTASAEEGKPEASASSPIRSDAHAVETASNPVELTPEIAALYKDYGAFCDAIVDDAREHRYALKRREIEAMAMELEKKIAATEAQSAALEKWVNRREEFAKQATEKVVEIYANMRPEASAGRLQQLDINLAASILLAISARQASPILNEMDEKSAASITAVMAASARMDDPS